MRLLGLWGRGRGRTNLSRANLSRTKRWRSSAAATAAFLAVVALSAVQINVYFGLNHTVGDLTGTAVARIQPLETGLTRAAGGPAATGLAHWKAPAGLPRRRHPQGGHPRHGLRLPEPGRLRLPPAGLPEFPAARAAGAGPLFRPAGQPRRLADRRRATKPAGPVRRSSTAGWRPWRWWSTPTARRRETPCAWTAGSPRRTPSWRGTCRTGSTARSTSTRIPGSGPRAASPSAARAPCRW